jgi:hypothetical protein
MVSGKKWILGSAVVGLSACMCMWVNGVDGENTAPAAPATQPIETHAARPKKVTEPWSYIKDLTPEQTEQIIKIHSDSLAEEKKIREKETADVTALLTPAQITELKEAEAKMKEGRREKRAKPTTAPT